MSGNLRDFGMIGSTLWQSDCFRSLEDMNARLAYIWLHCSYKTSAGVLRIGPAHMFEELDFLEDLADAQRVFNQLEGAGLIVRQRPFFIITKFLRYNPVKSYRHAISAWKEFLSIQDGEVKEALYRELKEHKGVFDLSRWRDKNGEPHSVIFEVQKYAEQVEGWNDEPLTNPLRTPYEPIGRGSGKTINRKEKREKRTPVHFNQDPVPRPSVKNAENKNFAGGPRPETLASVKRMTEAQ